MDVVELHRRCVASFLRRVRAIGPGRWGHPTPCADWDVRALVAHVVDEGRWTAPLMQGMRIADLGDAFSGDPFGDDPAPDAAPTAEAVAEEADADLEEAVREGRTVHLSFGDFPAEEYAMQLAADHLVHSWDLAVAIGDDATLDPDAVHAVAAWFAEREDFYRAGGAIGPRPPQPGDDAQSRLLAAFGRDSSWAPAPG